MVLRPEFEEHFEPTEIEFMQEFYQNAIGRVKSLMERSKNNVTHT
jgi:hypothetical protein